MGGARDECEEVRLVEGEDVGEAYLGGKAELVN